MVNRILLASIAGAVLTCMTGVAHAQVSNTDNTAGWPDAGTPPQTSSGVGSSFGGVIGDGFDGGVDMEVDSDTIGRVRIRVDQESFQCFGGDEWAVIYIDSVSGGYAGTGTFTDFTSGPRAAASGGATDIMAGTRDADLNFPGGFRPEYALVFRFTEGLSTHLYELRDTGVVHTEIAGGVGEGGGSCSLYEMYIDLADIGLSPGDSFRWIATAINTDSGARSDEAQGWTPGYTGNTTSAQSVNGANTFRTVGQVLINEMDSDTPGGDDREFVELFGPPGVDLDGTVLVFWNGNATGDPSYRSFDLDGESLNGSGYFVVGNPGVTPTPDITFADGVLQNGFGDGVGFYVKDFDPSNGTPVVGYAGSDRPRQNDWIDGVMDGSDSALEAELLAPSETGFSDFSTTALQRCGAGRGVQSNYLRNPGMSPSTGTPGAENNCSVCGDGMVDPIWEECEDTDGLPRGEEGRIDSGGPIEQDCCEPGSCTFLRGGFTCREGVGVCDAEEVCSGTSGTCPADDFFGPSVTCREEAPGGCDVAETCNGLGPSCPVDSFASPSTVCRASAGACDPAETCTGSDAACPSNRVEAMGTVCRPAAAGCDVAEVCDGTTVDCPADAVAMMGAICRMEAGDCDVAEICDGSSITCPTDVFLDATTVCRMAAGACDVEELCTGTAAMCPMDMLAMDGSSCDDGAACNGSESCMGGTCMSGTSLDCDDRNVCTTDMCSEPGGCSSVDIPGCCNIDGDCDDGDVCTADVCSGPGGTCSASPITGCCTADADCDDGNACTANTCDTSSNTCTTAPVPGCCAADTDCDDSNSCTTDTCDVATGSCMNDAVAGCCMTDGDCNDDNTCTMDSCDASTGMCANDAIAGCCLTDDDCDDGDECTTDMCDTATAACSSDRIPGCGPDADAGVDGGVGLDAGDTGDDDGGASRDAGTGTGGGDGAVGDAGTDVTEGGCACRATAPSGSSHAWLLALGAVAFWRRRRRR